MRRGVWVALSAVGVVLAASGLYRVSAQESSEAAPPAFKPASPLHDIMEVNGENFKELRKSMKPNPNYKKVAHYAHVIAEIGNVAAYHQAPSEADWWRLADGLKATALELAKAAEAKDEAAVEAGVGKLNDSCKACHDRFKQ